MNVMITIPSFGPHGGLNVIIQWANRLLQWHRVHLYVLDGKPNNTWMKVNDRVQICGIEKFWEMDCVIITSPHASHLLDLVMPGQRIFIFLQMLEHLFKPGDVFWMQRCARLYSAPHPVFYLSKWQADFIRKFQPAARLIPVTNGIDLTQFPISRKPKDGKTVLIESIESKNPTKDTTDKAAEVANNLRKSGYRIIGYGARPLKRLKRIPHRYVVNPSLKELNELYEQAAVFIKATRLDGRSTSPIEAMTKGTITCRALDEGDDDLVHDKNALVTYYGGSNLESYAKGVLAHPEQHAGLVENGYKHLNNECNWDSIIGGVNQEITRTTNN